MYDYFSLIRHHCRNLLPGGILKPWTLNKPRLDISINFHPTSYSLSQQVSHVNSSSQCFDAKPLRTFLFSLPVNFILKQISCFGPFSITSLFGRGRSGSNAAGRKGREIKRAMWPDWVIYWTLGNFLKPLPTIILPKSPTFLGNCCKGFKIYPFSCEIIFGQLL